MAGEVIPVGVEHAAVLHGLVRKRADYAGRLERCRAELRDLLTVLEHVDATIRLFSPEARIEAIRPSKERAAYAAVHGEVTDIVIRSLRTADYPLTSRELAAEVVSRRGLDTTDRSLEVAIAERVRACLRYNRVRGRVRAVPLQDCPQGWVLIGGKVDQALTTRLT